MQKKIASLFGVARERVANYLVVKTLLSFVLSLSRAALSQRKAVAFTLTSVYLALTCAAFAPQPVSADPSAPADADLQVVVVPKQDLEKGSTPTESSLEEKKIEKRLAPVNAVAGISEVVGRTLKRRKMKGSIILLDDLARPGDKLD